MVDVATLHLRMMWYAGCSTDTAVNSVQMPLNQSHRLSTLDSQADQDVKLAQNILHFTQVNCPLLLIQGKNKTRIYSGADYLYGAISVCGTLLIEESIGLLTCIFNGIEQQHICVVFSRHCIHVCKSIPSFQEAPISR